MNERLLQFIWQFQYFNRSELLTSSGEEVIIIAPGAGNSNQGPDFTDARIRINGQLWAGTIELHVTTSEWKHHDHANDRNYDNVILHVVWQHDEAVNNIPVLELHDRVSKLLLDKYERMMKVVAFIPCADSIRTTPQLVLSNWKERLLINRLERKSRIIGAFLEENNLHWEETFWWMLARNFGAKVNAGAFESVARSIPVNILARHKNQIHQVEAILLGQAGMLGDDFNDPYPEMLRKEYEFLRDKYQLPNVFERMQMLRMRPGNFPAVRLAQLAMLITASSGLFATIRQESSLEKIRELFNVTANDYWSYHYSPGQASSFKPKRIGEAMVENLIINTAIPMLFAYGLYHNISVLKDRTLNWMQQVSAENNKITTGFRRAGVEQSNAADTQALLELKTGYCDQRRCLECAIGNQLLKK